MSKYGVLVLPVMVCLVLFFPVHTQAGCMVFDDASDPVYSDGWQNGDNGGIGFMPWVLGGWGPHGHFIATSTQNGDGLDDGYSIPDDTAMDGLSDDGDIDVGGLSWGMWSHIEYWGSETWGYAEAIRPFADPLGVGQTFAIDMDNGYVESGRPAGFSLQNASHQLLWEFFFAGYGNYRINDASGPHDVPGLEGEYTTEGLEVAVVLTNETDYSATILFRNGLTLTVTGSLIPQTNQTVSEVRLWSDNVANWNGGSAWDLFFNAISISGPGPSMEPPQDVHATVPCGTDIVQVAYPDPAASGGCPPYSFSFDPSAEYDFGAGVTPVQCTATDSEGFTANSWFNVVVSVEDDEPPSVSCPPDAVVAGLAAIPAAATTIEEFIDQGGSATDSCGGGLTVTHMGDAAQANNTEGSTQAVIRTYCIRDDAGNGANCTQTFTVRTDQPPVIQPPTNRVFECGSATDPAHAGWPTVTDDYDDPQDLVLTYVDTMEPAECPMVSVITRTWIVTDSASNQATAAQSIGLQDTTPPVLIDAGSVGNNFTNRSADGWLLHPGNQGGYAYAASISIPPPFTNGYLRFVHNSGYLEYTKSGVVGEIQLTIAWVNMNYASPGNYDLLVQEGDVIRARIPLPYNGTPSSTLNVTNITVGGFAGGHLRFTIPYSDPFSHMSPCRSIAELKVSWEGMAATDACEGDLTDKIQQSVSVNPTQPGLQTVLYSICDACGNQAAPIVKTEAIADSIPPVIELLGDNPMTVEAGAGFTDPGATAWDNLLGDISSLVTVQGAADTQTPGTSVLTYVATDLTGNSTSTTRTVRVVDTKPPVITILGDNPVTLECGEPYQDAGATALDAASGDLTSNITVMCSLTPGPGTYGVYYTVCDLSGNTGTACRVIEVADTTPPQITCPPDQVVVPQDCGTVLFETPTVTDNAPGCTVTCSPPSGSVLGAGSHTITCTATDTSGNTSECEFQVTVLMPLRVVFGPPLESGSNVVNRFTVNSTIPHKIKLLDCAGNDVTAAMASLVTVKIDVTERVQTETGSALLVDVPEDYSGVGDAGGLMVFTGGQFQFNLKTKGYESGTVRNNRFFQSLVTVTYDTNPGTPVGTGFVLMESK